MKARVAAVLVALALAGGVLGAVWLVGTGGGSPRVVHRSLAVPKPKTYAELAAANYRVLSAKQSRRLLDFADAFVSCMAKKGIRLGRPRPHATKKIVMALPAGVSAMAVLPQSVACGEALGDPPKGSSLVQPKGGKAIELYLPKRCLLDRKVTNSRAQ